MERTRKVMRTRGRSLSEQVEEKVSNPPIRTQRPKYDGEGTPISTGSTLLDLAISGGRFREGGIPPGILVEIFGPSGAGKTVLLSSIAGNSQRNDRRIMFHDPEARLNKQFARMFGFDPEDIEYTQPNTVTEVFSSIRESAEKEGDLTVLADSLAALSTDMEMEDKDAYGMRRAKEFSEELRKTCRIITQKNSLVVCSNQIRQNPDAGPFDQKYRTPGGEAVAFYSSLRLRCFNPAKIKEEKTIRGVKHERVAGVETTIEVYKSSVWEPYQTAKVYILFDYGIDDIQGNLRYCKRVTKSDSYKIGDTDLGKNINRAIATVEEEGLEQELKDYTIDLWNEIQEAFERPRKPRAW